MFRGGKNVKNDPPKVLHIELLRRSEVSMEVGDPKHRLDNLNNYIKVFLQLQLTKSRYKIEK